MSTARLDYAKDQLRVQIEQRYDKRVEEADIEYGAMLDLEQRRDEWRAEAERAVRELHGRLESARDNELESFRLPACPRLDRYSTAPKKRWEEQVEKARDSRDRALGRLEGIRADANGTVSLTVNMLREWFGL